MKFSLRRLDLESVARELQYGLAKLNHDDNTQDFIRPKHWSSIPLRTTLTIVNLRTISATYGQCGKLVFVDAHLSFNITSGASSDIYIPLPIQPSEASHDSGLGCQVFPPSSGSNNSPGLAIIKKENGGEILIRNQTEGNWQVGSDRRIRVFGHYWSK